MLWRRKDHGAVKVSDPGSDKPLLEVGTLCCVHCGKRSNGWEVHNEHAALVPVTAPVARRPVPRTARPLPFVSRDIAPERRSA